MHVCLLAVCEVLGVFGCYVCVCVAVPCFCNYSSIRTCTVLVKKVINVSQVLMLFRVVQIII